MSETILNGHEDKFESAPHCFCVLYDHGIYIALFLIEAAFNFQKTSYYRNNKGCGFSNRVFDHFGGKTCI